PSRLDVGYRESVKICSDAGVPLDLQGIAVVGGPRVIVPILENYGPGRPCGDRVRLAVLSGYVRRHTVVLAADMYSPASVRRVGGDVDPDPSKGPPIESLGENPDRLHPQ